ncbi:Protein of unknown function [Pyronema omphalodes CBS 100304]|uniref:Uncharacterized protein n=1 Tax=Pyronema omphalodes (strain CBS 100304) TaxID=1076935 RepID=U4L1V5_PYROM|nr:Protein of unknown function [Pyronema omphalodes CBS 100304]
MCFPIFILSQLVISMKQVALGQVRHMIQNDL